MPDGAPATTSPAHRHGIAPLRPPNRHQRRAPVDHRTSLDDLPRSATARPSRTTSPRSEPANRTSRPVDHGARRRPGAGDAGGDVDPGIAAPRAPAPDPPRTRRAARGRACSRSSGSAGDEPCRSALPHARVPAPPPEVAAIERRLRTIDPGERGARIDVAVRAAAHHLADTGVQIGSVRIAKDGELILRLDGRRRARPPVDRRRGHVDAAGVGADRTVERRRPPGRPAVPRSRHRRHRHRRPRRARRPRGSRGSRPSRQGPTRPTTSCGRSDRASPRRSTPKSSTSSWRRSAPTASSTTRMPANSRAVDAAMHAATALVGSTVGHERSSFDLRTRRTGGEMWEPAVALFASADRARRASSTSRRRAMASPWSPHVRPGSTSMHDSARRCATRRPRRPVGARGVR